MFKFFHNSGSGSATNANSGGGGEVQSSSSNMGSVRDLNHALQQKDSEIKMKDSRILILEQELKKKDEAIQKLNRELDKYRSVLQPSGQAATPTAKPARSRNVGISAEPQSQKQVKETSQQPLKRHSKSSK